MNDLFSEQIFSVSDLTSLIKQTLEGAFYGISVEGEISNFRPASSGHWYFQLNDNNASLQIVMFKQKSWRLPFLPKDGDRVRVLGNISVYAKRGTYQLICEHMTKTGIGDILALLEERKRQFAQAGYFDEDKKKSLPTYPKRIGVVTSPTGAALHDILQVLGRRNPTINVTILPATVQGEGAGKTIAAQIAAANRWALADVLIVGRGGGSLEDLLPFSEQCVVEAIVASAIPIVSAVGHEIDWALSDYAADLRAPTPSAAAELVSPDMNELVEHLEQQVKQMANILGNRIALAKSRTQLFTPTRMKEYFTRKLEQGRLRTDDARQQMQYIIESRISAARAQLKTFDRQLSALSPIAVLDRGYAIVNKLDTGELVTSAEMLKEGDSLSIRFSQGMATAKTLSIEENNN
ncbi:exodeoxyribonuclease VII large subunit [Pleomorphochaeta sp. DL1XJH-081]|jgi:exodeoxyribonuclease VII large subunit|uniref:exodeoxyribonuclease VII large subunit n=1 Tax=Pleomorphochaeta sp. DL1XJH-081 TaxID=3409690 RepID=UPI003BB71759